MRTDDGEYIRDVDCAKGFANVDRWVARLSTVDYFHRLESTVDADAALIVAAVNALPDLIAELRRLREERAELRGALNEWLRRERSIWAGGHAFTDHETLVSDLLLSIARSAT